MADFPAIFAPHSHGADCPCAGSHCVRSFRIDGRTYTVHLPWCTWQWCENHAHIRAMTGHLADHLSIDIHDYCGIDLYYHGIPYATQMEILARHRIYSGTRSSYFNITAIMAECQEKFGPPHRCVACLRQPNGEGFSHQFLVPVCRSSGCCEHYKQYCLELVTNEIEEQKWLRESKRLLKEVRSLLRPAERRKASRSPRGVSPRAETSRT